jgi:glutamate dehydrogenase (NAD(P)+)
MAWMMDTYSMHRGYTVPAVVTGKPVPVGGSAGRLEATGRGVMIIAREAARHLGFDLAGSRVVVQGFGNVGSAAARLMARECATVVGVSDVEGGVYNPQGLDIPDLVRYLSEHNTVVGYPDAVPVTNEELLELPCDILVPAAVQNQVTRDNAPRIQARLIVEAANGPITPEADAILEERGICVMPDVLANAGGVIVSYFEWVQDLQFFFWTEDQVNAHLERILVTAFRETLAAAQQYRTTVRMGACTLGVSRVAEATRIRGIYP